MWKLGWFVCTQLHSDWDFEKRKVHIFRDTCEHFCIYTVLLDNLKMCLLFVANGCLKKYSLERQSLITLETSNCSWMTRLKKAKQNHWLDSADLDLLDEKFRSHFSLINNCRSK